MQSALECGQTPAVIEKQEFWQEVHGIVMTVIFLLVADFMLCVVRYWKSWSKYLMVHSLFGVFNLVSIFTIIMVIVVDGNYLFNDCFWGMKTSAQAHFIIGLFFVTTLVVVQIIGFVSKTSIESPLVDPVTALRRKSAHMYSGYFLYFLSKAQVLLGWWVYNYRWGPMMTFCIIYYVLFFSFKYLLLERWYRTSSPYLNRNIQKPLYNHPKYNGLLEMLSKGVSKTDIMKEYPNIKYVMYKCKIYDITEMVHPGGAFIIEKVIGEEISRYLHGAYGLESTKMAPYCHSTYALRLLEEFFVADLDTSTLGLMVPIIGDRLNVPTTWRQVNSEVLATHTKLYHFESDRYNLSTQPNILYLGRHFLLCPINILLAARLYSLSLCMSPPLREYTKSILDRLENEDSPPAVLKEKITCCLSFVIKMYEVGGFSEYLYNCGMEDEVKIEGPFGRGLEITEGVFYAFCGGTGVLPLLDLIYEILLKIYVLKVEKRNLNRLPDKFRLVMFLAINKAQVLNGLQLITKTYRMCKKHNLDMFDLRLRISSGETIEGVPQFKEKLNESTIRSMVPIDSEISRVIICGSPSMNLEVSTGLKGLLPESKIHIM